MLFIERMPQARIRVSFTIIRFDLNDFICMCCVLRESYNKKKAYYRDNGSSNSSNNRNYK